MPPLCLESNSSQRASRNIMRLLMEYHLRGTLRHRSRRQNSERFFPDSEINRTVARQLAIDLQGNVLFACDAEVPSLKILDLRNADVGAEYNILQVFDDFEIAEPFKHNDVEQSVVYYRVLKKWERPSIQPTISNKYEGSFIHGSIV